MREVTDWKREIILRDRGDCYSGGYFSDRGFRHFGINGQRQHALGGALGNRERTGGGVGVAIRLDQMGRGRGVKNGLNFPGGGRGDKFISLIGGVPASR